MLGAILLPDQLQGQVLVLLQFGVNGGEVGLRQTAGRLARRPPAAAPPPDGPRPSRRRRPVQAGLLRRPAGTRKPCSGRLRNCARSDAGSARANEVKDFFDLAHGQPLLRQPVSSTFQWRPDRRRWFVQRRFVKSFRIIPGMRDHHSGADPNTDRHQPGMVIAIIPES